jgi:hypothetical protein
MENPIEAYGFEEFLETPESGVLPLHNGGAAQQPQQWLPWTLDLPTFSLELDDYQVPLDEMVDSAHVLDWIFQIAQKGWATTEVLAGLVRAIDDLHHPQANICSNETDRVSTPEQARDRIRAAAAE